MPVMLHYSGTTHPSQGRTEAADHILVSTILVSNTTVNAQCPGGLFIDIMLMFQGNNALLAAVINT
jgi:hypothetical protein